MKKKPIYVVIEMTYDHFEFQKVIGAETNYETAYKIAQNYESYEWSLPVTNCTVEHKQFAKQEKSHIFIDSF